jgi:uncharacterized protein YbjT (DUF2867 family)
MKIFVTGGTGFVGREVLRRLAASGHEVVALVRPGSESNLIESDRIHLHPGDVLEPQSLPEGLRGCAAVIHLVGIIREFPHKGITFERLHVHATRNLIEAVTALGVKRLLHMSANGARPDGETGYHRTKWQAEELVRASGLDWTMVRPSLIFGPGGEFVEMLGDLVRQLPIVPVLGDGKYRMQPVAVGQVAETFVNALALPETIGQSYCLGGGESYSYDEVLDLVGKALGKAPVLKAHQPLALVKPMVKLLEHFERFPLTSEQLTMLLEGNECDQRPWAKTFGIDPISFAQGIADCFGAKA